MYNFGPRLSFAYNPSFRGGLLGKLFGERQMVIRGGISFLQDQNTFIFANSATTNFGTTSPRASLLNDPRFGGVGALPVQNVAPEATRPFTPFVEEGVPFGTAVPSFNYVIDPNFRIPYSFRYSLTCAGGSSAATPPAGSTPSSAAGRSLASLQRGAGCPAASRPRPG